MNFHVADVSRQSSELNATEVDLDDGEESDDGESLQTVANDEARGVTVVLQDSELNDRKHEEATNTSGLSLAPDVSAASSSNHDESQSERIQTAASVVDGDPAGLERRKGATEQSAHIQDVQECVNSRSDSDPESSSGSNSDYEDAPTEPISSTLEYPDTSVEFSYDRNDSIKVQKQISHESNVSQLNEGDLETSGAPNKKSAFKTSHVSILFILGGYIPNLSFLCDSWIIFFISAARSFFGIPLNFVCFWVTLSTMKCNLFVRSSRIVCEAAAATQERNSIR